MLPLFAKCWNCDLSHPEMLVLLCLASYADADGRNARPQVSTIAHRVGCTRRSVHRYLRNLEAGHYITGTKQPGKPTVYTLTPECGPQKKPQSGCDRTVSHRPICNKVCGLPATLDVPAKRETAKVKRSYGPFFPEPDDPAVAVG